MNVKKIVSHLMVWKAKRKKIIRYTEKFGYDDEISISTNRKSIFFLHNSINEDGVRREIGKVFPLKVPGKYHFTTHRRSMGKKWGSMQFSHCFTVTIQPDGNLVVENIVKRYVSPYHKDHCYESLPQELGSNT